MREPSICKRFYSDTFAPPSGFHSDARGPEVSAEEILAGGIRESDWSFPVLVSTPSIDRQGDSVIPEGCDYSAYSQSAIAFFDHQDIKFPVGSLRGPDGRLYLCIIPGVGILGRIWIRKPRPEDEGLPYTDACKTVWILVRDGLLNGISAGFDPIGPVRDLRGGGNEYKRWELLEVSIVAIAANRECRIIREPFVFDDKILKRFSPSVIKGLKTMSSPTVEKHIRHEGGKWILYSHDGKVLGKHDTREEAVKQEQAVKVNEAKTKSMSESSGTAGGYTVPEDHRATCKGIVDRMNDHDAKGHSLHFNPSTGDLHHAFPEGESDEKVKSIAADLHDAFGIKSMTQEHGTGPSGDGYHKIYPEKDMDGGDMYEENHKPGVRKSRQMSTIGEILHGMVRKGVLGGWIGKSLEIRVRKIMPRLLKSGMAGKKAIRIAWGIAGVQKGLLPLVTKAESEHDKEEDDGEAEQAAIDDEQAAADDATTDTTMDMPEEETAGGPDGLELVQTAIENLEAALPKLEPERREFWQGIIEQIKSHGEETYPDEDFAGEDTAGAEGAEAGHENDAAEQTETDEMLARYKSYRPVRVKRVSIEKVRKSFQKFPHVADVIRKTANHLHGIGDLDAEFDDKKGHAIIKGYTGAHHRACRTMARDLDRVHGAITKDDGPESRSHAAALAHESPLPPAHDDDMSYLAPHIKSFEAQMQKTEKTIDSLAVRAGVRA